MHTQLYIISKQIINGTLYQLGLGPDFLNEGNEGISKSHPSFRVIVLISVLP